MKNTQKGFTLVELLVVIAILAILATVGVAGYTAFIGRAEESNAQTEAHQINSSIDSFLMIDDEYVFFTDSLPTKAAPAKKVVKVYAELDKNGDIVVMMVEAYWNAVADDPATTEIDESLQSGVAYETPVEYKGEISLKGTDFESLPGRLYSYAGGKLGYVYDLGADATIGTDDDKFVAVK